MKILKKIFKSKKQADLELISNPKVLFNNKISVFEITLSRHKIGDSVNELRLDEVILTGLETYPKKTEGRIWKDDKTFVLINGKEIEFTLKERIEAVINEGGWIGYKDGSRFRIKNEKITSFSLHLERLSPYSELSKKSIIQKLGKRVKIKETYEEFDGTLFHTDIMNFERLISITWDDWDKKILVISLGDLVKEKLDNTLSRVIQKE